MQTAQAAGPDHTVCATEDAAGPGHLQVCRSAGGPGPGHTLAVSLEAKPADVAIGPYQVRTETLNGRYVPPVLALERGDRLEINLINRLPALPSGSDPNTINLHTHGLIVSPKNQRAAATAPESPAAGGMAGMGHGHGPGPGAPSADRSLVQGPGDNIYVSVAPNRSFAYRIDVPRELTDAGQGISPHPEGLFWYHPHIHGVAQRQVSAGMASAILIGSPKNALRRRDPSGQVVVDPDLIGKIDEQILILKDIELAVGKMPNEIGANEPAQARWIGAGGAGLPQDSQNGFLPTQCRVAPDSPRGPSWCQPDISTADQKIAWMFTVNGQVQPEVKVAPGRLALLRIVNTSPTVTYSLRLAKPAAAAPDGTPNTDPAGAGGQFAILAMDGTVPGKVSAPPAANALMVMRMRALPPAVKVETQPGLLLMPASRAEVLVLPDAGVDRLVLQTVGFRAGAREPADPGGDELADNWPAMDLATLAFGGNNTPPEELYFQPQLTLPAIAAAPQPGSVPPGCVQPELRTNQRRQIVLDSDGDVFLIGSRIITTDKDGNETVEPGSWIAPQPMPMMGPGAWASTPHVCVRQGSVETWEVINRTNEIHNFHIHQSKFTLAGPPVDPNGMLKDLPLFAGGTGTSLTAWHDTFPIPPAQQYKEEDPADTTKHVWVTDRDQPGSARFLISFAADQQVGRFVFHCHILEHEDKGMMAPIEVLPAPSRKSASAGKSGP